MLATPAQQPAARGECECVSLTAPGAPACSDSRARAALGAHARQRRAAAGRCSRSSTPPHLNPRRHRRLRVPPPPPGRASPRDAPRHTHAMCSTHTPPGGARYHARAAAPRRRTPPQRYPPEMHERHTEASSSARPSPPSHSSTPRRGAPHPHTHPPSPSRSPGSCAGAPTRAHAPQPGGERGVADLGHARRRHRASGWGLVVGAGKGLTTPHHTTRRAAAGALARAPDMRRISPQYESSSVRL